METPKKSPEEAQEPVSGPGHLLCQARKAASLDQKDVARHLNLELRFVDALERDDYEHMPPATFVRGYLIAYAKLVKVDVDKVLDLFDMDTTRIDTLRTKSMTRRQASMGDPSMRGVTYALVIALGVFSLIWWQGEFGSSDGGDASSAEDEVAVSVSSPRTGRDAPEEPPAVEVPQDPAPSAEVAAAIPEPRDTGMASAPVESAIESAGTVPENVDAETDVSTPSASAPISESDRAELDAAVALSLNFDGLGAVSTEDALASGEASTGSDPVSGNDATQSESLERAQPLTRSGGLRVGSQGEDRLFLSVNADCWVSVADARDRRLVYRIVRGGSTVSVLGDAPFRVTIGNAEAVDVRFNGEVFDHRAFHRGNIARFSIPVDSESSDQ